MKKELQRRRQKVLKIKLQEPEMAVKNRDLDRGAGWKNILVDPSGPETPMEEPPNAPKRPPIKEPDKPPAPPPPPRETPVEEPPNAPKRPPLKEPPTEDPNRKTPLPRRKRRVAQLNILTSTVNEL